MAEPEPNPVVEKPVEAPKGFGHGLMSLAESAAGKPDSKVMAPYLYVIVAAVIVLGVGILGFLLVHARRKAAILTFKLKEKEEDMKVLVEQLKLEKNEQVRRDAEAKASVLSANITEIKKSVDATEAESKDRNAVLAKLIKWDDLAVVDKRAP